MNSLRYCSLLVCCLLVHNKRVQAVEWRAAHEPAEIKAIREAMVHQLAEADRVSRETGKCAEWFAGADPETLQVAGEANGFLFATLLAASG